MSAALEWGAELIVSLDDDLLVPNDHIRRISRWIALRSDTGEQVGIVAPAVFDFHAVAERTMSEEDIRRAEAGELDRFPDTETLRATIASAWDDEVPVEALYHAGIRNWRYHYLDGYRSRAARLRELYMNARGIRVPSVDLSEMRRDATFRRAIVTGGGEAVAIHTTAGGACAYTADLVRRVGGVDEAFSPFGYEDSDFAVRSLEAGFINYSLPTEILLHDLDSRQKTRSPAILLHSQGRARALMARKHIADRERARAIIELIALAPLQAVELVGATGGRFRSAAGGILGAVVAYYGGIVEGMFATPTEPDLGDAGSVIAEHRAMPTSVERTRTVRERFWGSSPPSGLPTEVTVDATLSYRWEPDLRRFTLRRLVADSPGLFRVTVSAGIEQIGIRDELGNPDPVSARLNHLDVKIEDWGFLRRFETTAAWFRKERTVGYLRSLMEVPSRRTAKVIGSFLSLRDEPSVLLLSIQPTGSISVGELFELAPGIDLDRRLGLTVSVTPITHY
jgi:hypothetical protein